MIFQKKATYLLFLMLLCFVFADAQTDSLTQFTGRRTSEIRQDSSITPIKIDTTKGKNKYATFFQKDKITPKKVALMSLVVPGAGQIYNKTGVWWKLPLCYGGYVTSIVFISKNTKNYRFYKNLYKDYVTIKGFTYPNIDVNVAKRRRDDNRKLLEYSYVGLFGAHLFCVSDAFVTAHLNQFSINDDLSVRLQPAPAGVGLGLVFQY